MKALELVAESEFEYKEVDKPQIKDDEVLIRVKACGICGSDVHGMDGSSGRRIPPIIMGHEASGVIETLGSAVDSTVWKPGDRVTFDSMVYCGDCWHCRRGETNLCDNRMVLGVSCGDYRNHGAFAEFVAVPERILYKLPDPLSFEHAALTEAVSVAVHAVDLTPINLDDSAVVVGSGMIGLLVIQSLKAAGCGKVIAVDLDEERLALAKKLGATEIVKADSGDVPEAIRQMTEGRGADHAFEVVGMDPTLRTAIESTRKGGNRNASREFETSSGFQLTGSRHAADQLNRHLWFCWGVSSLLESDCRWNDSCARDYQRYGSAFGKRLLVRPPIQGRKRIGQSDS